MPAATHYARSAALPTAAATGNVASPAPAAAGGAPPSKPAEGTEGAPAPAAPAPGDHHKEDDASLEAAPLLNALSKSAHRLARKDSKKKQTEDASASFSSDGEEEEEVDDDDGAYCEPSCH